MAPNTLSRILSGGSRVMFGGTLCSNRHGFYRRQAELGNRLCMYIRCLSSFCRLLSSLCSGKACNYVLAPCLHTCRATANLWNGRPTGGGVSDVAHTLAKYVLGVAHTYIARRSSLALPPSTLIIAWHERIQAGLSMPWQHALHHWRSCLYMKFWSRACLKLRFNK